MITRSPIEQCNPDWRRELREAYRDPQELLAALGLSQSTAPATAGATFPFHVTRAFAARMRGGDPNDPLLLQVLPQPAEDETVAGFSDDPLSEFTLGANHGYLQKYHGRALLVMTGACAINCRYCFRRAFPYREASSSRALATAVAAIARDDTISEVILSGGDPLLLADSRLAAILDALAAIGHVRRLRIHSRLPVVLPSRMTAALLAVLRGTRLPVVLVIHTNHAQEIDSITATALLRCRDAGITLLNQAVLLKRINDDAEVMEQLSESLFAAGVLPYYVHLLDRVTGTAHFEVSDERALAIEAHMRARLPGYLVPRFVRECADAASKLPLTA